MLLIQILIWDIIIYIHKRKQKIKFENIKLQYRDLIDEFESEWTKWDLNETMLWFKYVFIVKNDQKGKKNSRIATANTARNHCNSRYLKY